MKIPQVIKWFKETQQYKINNNNNNTITFYAWFLYKFVVQRIPDYRG